MMSDDMFAGVALETPENVDTRIKDEIVTEGPSPTDVEWNDYVLSLFDEGEMYDGRPLCAGLRRVAELLIGRIVVSRPTQVFAPQSGDEIGRATVIWEIVFEDGSIFSDVADCWEGNTDDTFCVFNTATAATRAEGRALRKALRLKTVAAEEMTKKNTASIVRSISQTKAMEATEGEYNDSDRMTDKQENFIDVKCSSLDINVVEFMKEVFNVNVKRKVSKGHASEAIQKLNAYQQEKNLILDSIKGYQSNWRN
jgi:hypothetical protein